MQAAVLIKLRPAGPWRSGPGEGGRDHADVSFGSDRLFSAVTIAMKQLGFLDEWLDATARAKVPAVAFTSLFPFQPDALYAPPPASLWPPPAHLVTTPSPVFLAKMRWTAARFVPVSLVELMLLGQKVLADQWLPDAQTGCLLRRDRPSMAPFRTVSRASAAVDRTTFASVSVHSSACVEFEPAAGLWGLARFADAPAQETWRERVQAAFRLLADTGLGGGRTKGWGQIQVPEFQAGSWPGILMPKLARRLSGNGTVEDAGYWLLSLFSPGASDAIDWSRGDYSLVVRGGFVHNSAQPKKTVRLVSEGSVLASEAEPAGTVVNVAPENSEHPVYRSGFAVAFRIPVIEIAPQEAAPVETPKDEEALEPPPCEEKAEEQTPAAVEPEPVLEPSAEPESEEAGEEQAMPVTGEPEQGLAPEPEPEPQPHPELPNEPEPSEPSDEV